jgi:hypothetical protein
VIEYSFVTSKGERMVSSNGDPDPLLDGPTYKGKVVKVIYLKNQPGKNLLFVRGRPTNALHFSIPFFTILLAAEIVILDCFIRQLKRGDKSGFPGSPYIISRKYTLILSLIYLQFNPAHQFVVMQEIFP